MEGIHLKDTLLRKRGKQVERLKNLSEEELELLLRLIRKMNGKDVNVIVVNINHHLYQ